MSVLSVICHFALFLHERDHLGISAMARDLWGGVPHSRGAKNSPMFDALLQVRNISCWELLSLSFLRPDDTQYEIFTMCATTCTYMTAFCHGKTLLLLR